MNPVLEVNEATVEFGNTPSVLRALDNVSLKVEAGETIAVVGESGCGKTTLARAVLGLQPLVNGEINLLGSPVKFPNRESAQNIGMVWQDPFASLDPRWTVRKSILEPIQLCRKSGDVSKILHEVGLDDTFLDRYPHQMSGGQRQRVAIGRAIALRPPLIVCDEPTAALDLSIRAQILNLLKRIQGENQCSYLYISHDLSTVRFLADRVAVMYLGQIVELGNAHQIFTSPRHPYTKALLDSAPDIKKLRILPEALPGEIPDPRQVFTGCKFANRCVFSQDKCRTELPALDDMKGTQIRCHFPLNAPSLTILR